MTHTGRRGHVNVSRAWLADPRLTDSGLRLMLWLDSHTDSYLASVDQQRTARELRWSRDRVRRALMNLTELGVVTVEQVPHSNIGTRTHITIHLDAWTSPSDASQGTDQCLTASHTSALSQVTPVPYGKAPSTRKNNLEEQPLVLVQSFETFWALYPRKQGKQPAAKKWQRMTPEQRHAALDALPAWTDYWERRNEPDFVPHGSTWLNQERWSDTIPAPPKPRMLPAMELVQRIARG